MAGVRVGAWTWCDRSNRKEKAGAYVGGKREGVWQEWWESKLSFTGRYAAGKPDGEFVYFDRRGRELGRFTIADGTGTMLTFHANRRPASRQQLTRGVRSGRYEELSIARQAARRGALPARPQARHVEGVDGRGRADARADVEATAGSTARQEVRRRQDRDDRDLRRRQGRTAPYAEYRAGKPAMTGEFVDDRKHGTWTTYDADGGVNLTATYQAGVLDGPWRQLVDGAVIEGTMSGGRRAGTWTRHRSQRQRIHAHVSDTVMRRR